MTIDHVIEPLDEGILLTERAALSGPLAGLVGRLLGRRMEAMYVETTKHGANLAESR